MQTESPTLLNLLVTDHELEYGESYTGTVVSLRIRCVHKTLTQKFLFLENFAITYDTDTLLLITLYLRTCFEM